MKPDRFFTWILIGIGVLVILAFASYFLRRSNQSYSEENTPEGVVRNYVLALHKNDYARAYAYLAEGVDKPTQDEFEDALLNRSIDPTGTSVQILSSDVGSAKARVNLSLSHYSGDMFSSPYQESFSAVLEKDSQGNWKITSMPYSYWSYDWYNPTPEPAKPGD